MQSILDAINEWIKEILIGAINGNLSTMFGDVNEKVGTIAAEVGQTPQGWNAGIFSMIQSLSENVIVPIAGLVITYVLCVELISMVTEKNNMHDIDTFMFFKWFFKAWVAVYLVTHTFTITMAVFDMAQHVVSGAAGVIGGDTNIDVDAALSSMQAGLDAMEIPELLLLVMETSLVSLCMKIMSVLITVILYGRMIEIYLYCSVSPIPFATMTNREWGQIGNNYLKALFALGFQGFLIMICVGIYAVLVGSMIVADNLHALYLFFIYLMVSSIVCSSETINFTAFSCFFLFFLFNKYIPKRLKIFFSLRSTINTEVSSSSLSIIETASADFFIVLLLCGKFMFVVLTVHIIQNYYNIFI